MKIKHTRVRVPVEWTDVFIERLPVLLAGAHPVLSGETAWRPPTPRSARKAARRAPGNVPLPPRLEANPHRSVMKAAA